MLPMYGDTRFSFNRQMLMLQQGLTTAAQKINRKGILQKYKKQVDKAYSRS